MESVNLEIANARQLYLDLMKRCLTFSIWGETVRPLSVRDYPRFKRFIFRMLIKWLGRKRIHLISKVPFDTVLRAEGKDHPAMAHTMIGMRRLDNLQFCIEDVIANNVPGDLIETGVWRGGATIFMRAVLEVYEITDRKVWAADSFEGLPCPNPEQYPADRGDTHYLEPHLAVSLEEVKLNFSRYGLLDEQVCFLKGWFKDTLPNAPIERLSILRLDGDMYESTMDALANLYDKVSTGGYVIIDDYWYAESCRKAVSDFRASRGIEDKIKRIDSDGVFWKRSQHVF